MNNEISGVITVTWSSHHHFEEINYNTLKHTLSIISLKLTFSCYFYFQKPLFRRSQ